MYTLKPILAAIVFMAGYVSASALPEASSNIAQRQNLVPLSFGNAEWIWTDEEVGGDAPIGSRGFRYQIINPSPFILPICLTLAVAADNEYDLYVNGFNIGNDFELFETDSAFEDADIYNVPLNAEGQNIIAINATNGLLPTTSGLEDVPNPAGLIVTGIITFSTGLQEVLISNSTWLTLAAPTPANFFEATFNDAAWVPASDQGMDGVSPWGATTIVPNNVIGCLNF
ncbi:hypothetical protein BT96DRAFT_934191 [Gymnopus androsaceus JB14]|uniref:Uncharacterized protein n=1 Tax=Gymnopus androsaceus JB14 TaxID=1447944 RepID=A0A6A4I8Z4_9AGAR|nr:hypothetical protein BT96DRAFT_934191 [Gymnopus androsaceus JB14]